jgi:glycosyltransferase involved in cell wall biosynthesis
VSSPREETLDGRSFLIIGVDGRELQGRPTGVGRYLRNLLRVWSGTTADRLVLYFNGKAPADPVLAHPHIVSRPLEPGHRGLLFQELQLPRATREDGVEVLFCPAYTCPLSLKIPRVTTIHDLSFFSVPEDFTLTDGARRRFLVAASLRASRALLANSAFTKREIQGRFPDTADRVVDVPLGADDDLAPAPPREEAERRVGPRRPFLLSVGSILNRRCLPDLLRAIALLRPSFPSILLDVVGENRTHPKLNLEALVSSLSLEDHVRLSGFVSEAALADRYAAADAAVFLSEYEGFGLPALEALSRGLPLLTSVRPATGEIFRGAASLVEPRDPLGIARALEELLSNAPLRDELREKGLALAARLSLRSTAERTLAVLVSALAR